MFDWRRSASVAFLAIAAFSATGRAETVTFDSLSIDRLDLAGPQVEAGFSYEALSGSGWEVQTLFGNPTSALATFFNLEGSAAGDKVVFSKSGGGTFSFLSVDTSTPLDGNSDEVTITGYLGSTVVGTLILDASTPTVDAFMTVASSFLGEIDLLEVLISRGIEQGTSNGRILDNFMFRTSAVPEPSSFALAGVGAVIVAMISGAAHRKAAR